MQFNLFREITWRLSQERLRWKYAWAVLSQRGGVLQDDTPDPRASRCTP